MPYHDILLHVDNSDACAARIATAMALAERHGAHLCGYCVVTPENIGLYGEAAIAPSLIQAALRREKTDLAAAKARFDKAIAGAGLTTTCTAGQGQPSHLLAEAAIDADVAIVGQPDADDPRCASHGVAAAVAFGSGGGVLVHPRRGKVESVGKRVLLAWDGSREARRATFESLPLLNGADHVEVACVTTDKQRLQDTDEPARGICERLGRRGIEAHEHCVSATDEAIANTLLARCLVVRADLLVLGAYGHSRLREFLLGGVTRQILAEHEIPLLIAH